RLPFITTWPAFSEAMYLIGKIGAWNGQEALWKLVQQDDLQLETIASSNYLRVFNLMKKYADLPMDLADATLVALAEQRKLNRIFTLDTDFEVYRLKGRHPFEIIPNCWR